MDKKDDEAKALAAVKLARVSSYGCARFGIPSDCARIPVYNYQNSNDDQSLFWQWTLGLSSPTQYFNQWDPMTQSLMRDKNTQETLGVIRRDLAARGPYYGLHPYKDHPNPQDLAMDVLGALSQGTYGHNWADSFTGSYKQQWEKIPHGNGTRGSSKSV
ncbi:MAG TPA: hypothetical protein VMV92_27775 [Streptosporangiaceae bacterium]|nr:hypothetical protein [Streptosporangiaceae bacterium]